jgi:hypothetical protein
MGHPYYEIDVDGFKMWAPLFHYRLMVLKRGPPYYEKDVDGFKEWATLFML